MSGNRLPHAEYMNRVHMVLDLIHKYVDYKAIINTNQSGIKYTIFDGHTKELQPKRDAVTGELFLTRAGNVTETPTLVRVVKFLPSHEILRIARELSE